MCEGCPSVGSKGGAVLQRNPTSQLLNQTLQDSIPVTSAYGIMVISFLLHYVSVILPPEKNPIYYDRFITKGWKIQPGSMS